MELCDFVLEFPVNLFKLYNSLCIEIETISDLLKRRKCAMCIHLFVQGILLTHCIDV